MLLGTDFSTRSAPRCTTPRAARGVDQLGRARTLPARVIQAYHEIFVEAAALGVICAACRDHGVADLDASHWDGKIHVDHPAADDLVLACGGTQIDAQNRDVAWNDGTPFNPNTASGGGWSGGGGISTVFRCRGADCRCLPR